MKKNLYIFLHTALILLCTSCENMFNKMITYNGDPEPPVLCLNAEVSAGLPMKVYLTRSWFFLDTERYVGDPRNNIERRGIVSDATVEMQVNNGEWLALNYIAVPDTTLNGHRQEGKSYYTTTYTVKAGDNVTIRASHPDYKTVTATETVPPMPVYSVLQQDPIEMVLPFTFCMDALPTATKDQIVYFSITAFGSIVDTVMDIYYHDYTYTTRDTFIVADKQPIVVSRIYSEDFMFSEYDLPRTTHNYYTQNGSLYTSADHFVEPQNVTILLDCAKWSYNGRSTWDTLDIDVSEFDIEKNHRYAALDSIVIKVRLSNQSFYMYRTTVYGKSSSTSGPEISLYSEGQGGDDFGDIFDEIAELFSELGNQAGTQIYSNVENGFGHLSFINQSKVIIPVNIPIDINDKYYYD